MGRYLPLACDDHCDVHHHKFVARVQLSRSAVSDERGRVGRVVHVGNVSVGSELDELVSRSHPVLFRLHYSQVDQGWLVPTSPKADEDLWGTKAAMVEVGGLLGRGEVDQLVRVGCVLTFFNF